MSDEQDKKDEVGAELGEFLDSGASDDESGTHDEKDDTKVEDKPTPTDKSVDTKVDTKVETKDDGKVDTKVDTKVATKGTKTVAPEDELKDDLGGMSDKELRSLVRGLRTRVDEVHGKLVTAGVAIKPDQKVETTIDDKTEQKIEKKVEAEVINFMKDINMDEIMKNLPKNR